MQPMAEIARRLNRRVRGPRHRLVPKGEFTLLGELRAREWRLGNGLTILLASDPATPLVSFQTWFDVGSRHERPGKTGLAHLFEHLMFKETRRFGPGEFDRRLEATGAEANAATWTDWTCYHETLPSDQISVAIELESDRMQNLKLEPGSIEAEKEVVANERRYTVDDDVEGAAMETLWANAFRRHPYRWPTIGRMRDIRRFTVEDCRWFYRTWVVPNNATLVVVGDLSEFDLLGSIREHYRGIRPARRPDLNIPKEPRPRKERRVVCRLPTDTPKVGIGYHAPAYGDSAYLGLGVAAELLGGGRSSRLYRALVTDRELATDVNVGISPFKDPGLFTVWADARPGCTSRDLLRAIDREIGRLVQKPPTEIEIEKACNELELENLTTLETAHGKADLMGFSRLVLGDVAACFARVEAYRETQPRTVQREVHRWLDPRRRTVVCVEPSEDI